MDWKECVKTSYKNGDDLKEALTLNESKTDEINRICGQYPMLINEYYFSLIDRSNPSDPIRKMSVPSPDETYSTGSVDTSGEAENTKLSGMQHKYEQTALIISSNECFMYCRHCFRKRMVGLTDDEVAFQLKDIKEYITSTPSINNVLLTGGDSFFNSNDRIFRYLELLTELEQLDFIRFGTRAPVVLPQRISDDKELLSILKQFNEKKQIYVVTQFNHPREVTIEAVRAVKALQNAGIIIKNQTVLLKGVNDSAEVLGELLTRLTAAGVVPYYIFQCRPVRGVLENFQIPLKEGYKIVDQAKNMQNGQGKCIRYVMSHPSGKIEIIGENPDGQMIFKYHQAKDKGDYNRIFIQKVEADQCWIF